MLMPMLDALQATLLVLSVLVSIIESLGVKQVPRKEMHGSRLFDAHMIFQVLSVMVRYTARAWPKISHWYIIISKLLVSKKSLLPFISFATDHSRLSTFTVHNDPSFFPCHRHFTLNWLKRLRQECHYEGDSLYLDVNTYADDLTFFKNQDLWGYDNLGSLTVPVVGNWENDIYFEFVGSRRNDSTEVIEAAQTLNRGAFEKLDDGTSLQLYMQSQLIRQALAIDDYNIFRREIEKKVHDAFHNSIKRTMFPGTSPYDAFLFFPFHSFIDCIWLKWQEKSKTNLLAYDGLHRGTEQAVSVKDGCAMLGLGDDLTVADILDASENPGCFDCPDFQI